MAGYADSHSMIGSTIRDAHDPPNTNAHPACRRAVLRTGDHHCSSARSGAAKPKTRANRLHHENRKEVPPGKLPVSLPQQDFHFAERRQGKWLHGVQRVSSSAIVLHPEHDDRTLGVIGLLHPQQPRRLRASAGIWRLALSGNTHGLGGRSGSDSQTRAAPRRRTGARFRAMVPRQVRFRAGIFQSAQCTRGNPGRTQPTPAFVFRAYGGGTWTRHQPVKKPLFFYSFPS